jgi:hypothetical protein
VSALTRHKLLAAFAVAFALGIAGSGTAFAAGTQSGGGAISPTGGAAFVPPPPPPARATVLGGRAVAPASAPPRVRAVIEAGNQIIGRPYRYGGGHRRFSARSSRLDSGYDCSGSVSHALYGGRFLRTPLNSSGFMSWGQQGPGQWITVYAHGGHAYLVVAGLRLDTSLRDDPTRTGPQWSLKLRKSAAYQPRHPAGL